MILERRLAIVVAADIHVDRLAIDALSRETVDETSSRYDTVLRHDVAS